MSSASAMACHEVIGVDKFLDNYPQPYKEDNLSALRGNAKFTFIKGDVARLDLSQLFEGVEYLLNQAAHPRVR